MSAAVYSGSLSANARANAALLAASILSLSDPAVATALEHWRAAQTASVPDLPEDPA